MKLNKHTLRCFNQHMGHWMMENGRFWQLHDFIMSQDIKFESDDSVKAEEMTQEEVDAQITPILSNGIMIVPIEGTIMRAQSSFGGTSSVQIRRILRNASRNDKVKAVMLNIDSPGGTVAGTDEMAQEIRRFSEIKPIHAHVNGLMASAAYWTGSQSKFISASRTSEVGSLGTVAVVQDLSEAAEREGVKVHVISTGPFKGAFTPGSEVTQEQLDNLQETVNKLNTFFMDAVQEARGLPQTTVSDLFDGRVHLAEDALNLGLIDGVMSFEQAMVNLEGQIVNNGPDENEILTRARAKRLR